MATENKNLVTKIKSNATLIQQLKLQSDNLTRRDIAEWRSAHQAALSVENPQRAILYNIYNYTIDLDDMVTGIVLRSKFGVMSRPFKIVGADGKINQEAGLIFGGEWFQQYMNFAIEAHYFGHSLIELGDVVSIGDVMGFAGIRLVPRQHVCPELGVLLVNPGDDPKRGVSYRTPQLQRVAVEVGDPYSLGAYLKIAPAVIGKKNATIFWDNFAERFGIPIIYAKVDSRDKEERAKASNMLRNLGSNAWALFGSEVTIDTVKAEAGNSIEVFDRRISRADTQISLSLAGQTMSFTDGSSLSQAEVHERGFKEIKDKMARDLAANINTRLIPAMLLNGFPLQGCRFEWNDTYNYTPQEMLQIEGLLLQYYKIKKEYFINRYNVDIEGEKVAMPGLKATNKAGRNKDLDFFA